MAENASSQGNSGRMDMPKERHEGIFGSHSLHFWGKKKRSKNQYWPPEAPKLLTRQKYTSTTNLRPQLATKDTWSNLLPPKLLSLTHEQARVTEPKWTFQ